MTELAPSILSADFAHLGEDGKNFVHTVMEFTLNYQYHVTEKKSAVIQK